MTYFDDLFWWLILMTYFDDLFRFWWPILNTNISEHYLMSYFDD